MGKYYPIHWNRKYKKQAPRAHAKAGASHIIWVASPELKTKKEVADVQYDLIETMNPSANIMRKTPPMEHQDWTRKIIAEFRKQIHDHRGNQYSIDLMTDL